MAQLLKDLEMYSLSYYNENRNWFIKLIELEKQQIIDAFDKGVETEEYYGKSVTAEQYYSQTYTG